MSRKKRLKSALSHLLLAGMGFVLIYPLIWLFFGSFKTNAEIRGSIALLPESFSVQAYIDGWAGTGQYTFGTFFRNSFVLVIPTVLLTAATSFVAAYGFARFRFPGRQLLFLLMLMTLMLPNTVLLVPRYILFRNLSWLDSYLPFIVPALSGGSAFFIFMQYQFLRGIPGELDEAAWIDGANSFMVMLRVLMPLSKPAIFSAAIFQFIWTWNDFFNVLIYINSVKKFPVSLGLRLMVDIDSATNWNRIMAMSVLTMLPCVIFYCAAQRYFVEGIATTGLKL